MKNNTSFLAGIGLVVVGLAVALVTAELGLRAYAGINTSFASRLREYDVMSVKIVPMGTYGYRQRPNRVFRYGNGTEATANALGYRGPAVAVRKPDGVIRVVLVGGSTTHGWGVDDNETIDAYMRRDFGQQCPATRFQVINLGFDGYDSYQDYLRIRTDGLRFAPDVIIVNAGINDVRNARFAHLKDPDPRTLLWRSVVRQLRDEDTAGHASFKVLLKHYSFVARFASMVRDTWQRRHEGREATARATPHYGALEYFERNIRRIASLAAERKIALLLSTPPSAIPDNFAPDSVSPRGYWITDAAVTQEVRDSLDTRLRRIADELSRSGLEVSFVPHHVPSNVFLDDAHLTARGNALVAADFAKAVLGILKQTVHVACAQQ